MNDRNKTADAMEKQATTMLMGSLKEMLSHQEYCYVASTAKYSEIKAPGEQYILSLVKTVLPLLIESSRLQALNEAESLMLNKLTK